MLISSKKASPTWWQSCKDLWHCSWFGAWTLWNGHIGGRPPNLLRSDSIFTLQFQFKTFVDLPIAVHDILMPHSLFLGILAFGKVIRIFQGPQTDPAIKVDVVHKLYPHQHLKISIPAGFRKRLWDQQCLEFFRKYCWNYLTVFLYERLLSHWHRQAC